jgi:hypothetical protein
MFSETEHSDPNNYQREYHPAYIDDAPEAGITPQPFGFEHPQRYAARTLGSDEIKDLTQRPEVDPAPVVLGLGTGLAALYGLRSGGISGYILALLSARICYDLVEEVSVGLKYGSGKSLGEPAAITAPRIRLPLLQTPPKSVAEGDLVRTLDTALSTAFEDETFLPAEIDAVLQAFVTSIRWAVIRVAGSGTSLRFVDTLHTDYTFSSAWMTRGEILNRIEDTSGLPPEAAETALTALEEFVTSELKVHQAVEIEDIGTVRRKPDGGLVIHLVPDLQFR